MVAASVIGGGLVGWALLSPYLAYVRWSFTVDPELMLMRYGIIFHEERLGELHILPAGRRITGGMVVHQNDRCRADRNGRFQYLSWVDD